MKPKTRYLYQPTTVTHPGEILLEKLEEMGISAKEFALRTNKPEKTISAVLNGHSAITRDMAILFEQVTQIPAHFWINAQGLYDEAIARAKAQADAEAASEWAKHFPLKEMVKLGVLPNTSKSIEKTKALLSFFGISAPESWENLYYGQKLAGMFRISLRHTRNPYALSAWLRMGDVQSSHLEVAPYSQNGLKKLLPVLRPLIAAHPADCLQQLQALCATVGLKVVYTPPLPKAPVNGATRWIGQHPVIQLSGRYKRNDIFWFTFFHEVGHVLLHGKRRGFLELKDNSYDDEDQAKEDEANTFAANFLLPPDQEQRITSYTLDDLRSYAQELGTHPAILLGRLQYRGHIPPSYGNELFVPIDLPAQPI